MKLLKALFSIVLLLVVVCAIAIGCFIYFMDANKLKPVLAEEVKQQTGYILVMDGDLSWSLYPSLGVKIEHLTLKAPEQAEPFLDLHGVHLATELMQLLHGKQVLEGAIKISDVRLLKVHAQDVSADLHWEQQVLTVQSIKADLYDGSLVGVAHARNLTTTPQWDWNVRLNGVQLQPLLIDVDGADSKLNITGTGNVKMQALTQGKTSDELLKNVSGTVEFSLNNGLVKGMDLNYLVQTADALINKKPVTAPTTANQTAFNSFAGTFNMDKGVAVTQNLLLLSPALVTKGQGTITLASNTLNLQLAAKPQQSLKTQWEIPVLVTGTITDPNVRLDMMEIEKAVAKQELHDLKTQASDAIKKHIPGKTGEILQNLIGN